jgi:divalent metal cation (Fe/Co/Zn/Cd) transporter
MKRLHITLVYSVVGDTHLDVPDELSVEEAIEYAKEHMDYVRLPYNAEYIEDSEVLDEENCDFEDEN